MTELRRGHLLGKPLALLFLFALIAMGLRPWSHAAWAWVLFAATLIALEVITLWLVCRSDFGPWHRVFEAVQFVAVFSLFLAAGAVALIGPDADGLRTAMAWVTSFAWCLLPTLGSAWLCWARLRHEGFEGPWALAHVDLRQGLIRTLAGAQPTGDSPRSGQWVIWVPVAVTNLPLVWRMLKFNEVALAGMAWLLLGATLAWVAGRWIGPALAESLFVLQIQAASGTRLRHEGWQEAQAIRRGFWLSRWLMLDTTA